MTPRNPLVEHYYDNIYRPLIDLQLSEPLEISPAPGPHETSGVIRARACTIDGLTIDLTESLAMDSIVVKRIRYSYQATGAGALTVCRYDNRGHHLGLPHYPHHKHVIGVDRPLPNPSNTLVDFTMEMNKYIDVARYMVKPVQD